MADHDIMSLRVADFIINLTIIPWRMFTRLVAYTYVHMYNRYVYNYVQKLQLEFRDIKQDIFSFLIALLRK